MLIPTARRSERLIGSAASLAGLGEHFGHGLYAAELDYLAAHEWVATAEDALWRRTKLGMWLDDAQRQRVAEWLAARRPAAETSSSSENSQGPLREALARWATQSLTGLICQISSAYSRMVRSDEKYPMLAIFCSALRAHSSGWAYTSST